jgi:hypothetical protein
MIVRVLLATVLAATAFYGWGYLFWQVLPLGSAAMEEEPFGGEELASDMTKVLPNTGVYFIPFPPNTPMVTDAERTKFEERHRQGPIVRIFYTKTGAEPAGPSLLMTGYAHSIAIAFLMAIILAATAAALPTYIQRVGVVFLIGAVAAVWLGLNEAIWFYHPWKFELYQAGYVLVGGLIMGMVMAAIIKPRGQRSGEAA